MNSCLKIIVIFVAPLLDPGFRFRLLPFVVDQIFEA